MNKIFLFVFLIAIFQVKLIYSGNFQAAPLLLITIQDDEFKEFQDSTSDDEFKEFTEDSVSVTTENIESQIVEEGTDYTPLYWLLSALGFTILAGFLVRFKPARNLRGIFLLISLFTLGFYLLGCTACPVNTIQDSVLFLTGYSDYWYGLMFLGGLILITYLFGKVWCGWVCHFGALQEFLFLPGRFNWLKGKKFQTGAKIARYILFAALLVQLIVMGVRYWCRIDPFVNIFDFRWTVNSVIEGKYTNYEYYISLALTVLLLFFSVVSYRPFCRTMCPMGLLLGFIAKIPGASVIGLKNNACISCIRCNNACKIDAILREEKVSTLDNQECIACGDCIESCQQDGLKFVRRNNINKDKIICSSNKSCN